MDDQKKYSAVCSSCGKETTVPFEPVEGRPVYCIDCYKKQKDSGRNNHRSDSSNREMHDAVCSACGVKTQVPFVPRMDRPIYCRDCYQKQKAA